MRDRGEEVMFSLPCSLPALLRFDRGCMPPTPTPTPTPATTPREQPSPRATGAPAPSHIPAHCFFKPRTDIDFHCCCPGLLHDPLLVILHLKCQPLVKLSFIYFRYADAGRQAGQQEMPCSVRGAVRAHRKETQVLTGRSGEAVVYKVLFHLPFQSHISFSLGTWN